MKKAVFADTIFWVALIRKDDQHRSVVLPWQQWIQAKSIHIVTTEAVFWEFLNISSDIHLRQIAANSYQACMDDPSISIVRCQSRDFRSAFEIYRSRMDKEWSLTDCLSFQVMTKRRLSDALTTDHHFRQAGFRPLLLEEPP
jgi:predicted nucleic acid-binding protein